MCSFQGLKVFVQQRLTAAVEEIFGHVERTITEYEEEMDRRHRRLLDEVSRPGITAVFPADIQQLLESKEEVPPEQQQEWSSGLDQQDPEDPPHIKEEQEELWTSQEGEQLQGLEEADITKFTFTPVPVTSEDDDDDAEKSPSSQLHQRQTEEMKTEADGEEPASNMLYRGFILRQQTRCSARSERSVTPPHCLQHTDHLRSSRSVNRGGTSAASSPSFHRR
eukprot:superscaffoldBa00006060_g21088